MFHPTGEIGESIKWSIKLRKSAFYNLRSLNPEPGTDHFGEQVET